MYYCGGGGGGGGDNRGRFPLKSWVSFIYSQDLDFYL